MKKLCTTWILLLCGAVAVRAQERVIINPLEPPLTVSLRPVLSGDHTATNCTVGISPVLVDGSTYYGCTATNTWTAFAAGSSTAFSAITGSTNNSAAMVITTGASLGVTGSGTIAATSVTGFAPAAGKTLTVSNSMTQTATDGSTVAFGGGGTVLYNGGALGTPSSGTLTNATGLPTAGLLNNAVTLAKLATQAADTILINATGGAAVPSAVVMPTGGTNGCAGASDAIGYNNSTHAFVCNTISAGSSAFSSLTGGTNTSAAMIVGNGATFALTGTATFDASAITAANGFKIKVAAGLTATVNGSLGYDSTNNMLHGSQSTADAFIPQFTVTPTNAHCATWVVSGSNYKLGDAACPSTPISGATTTAIVTAASATTLQTPSATATLDSSGNFSTPGGASFGVGGSVAGEVSLGQGTATTPAANTIVFQAPTSVTAYSMSPPSAAGTGFILNTDTSNVDAWTFVGFSGTGNVCRVTSCTMVTPALGVPSALTLTNATGLPSAAIIAAFTSCSGSQYLGADGACHNASGGGTVTSAVIAGTANQITAGGTCTITTSGTCTLSLPNGVILGTDNSAAGTLQLANGSANAHTIFSSGATTTNTIQGFAAVPTTGHLLDCTVTSTTCLMHDSGVVTANVVNASSPGVGLAHFAGSTQTVTSSTVATGDIAANAVTSAKLAVVNTYRQCDIPINDTSGSAITSGQMGPQSRVCFIPAAATIVEMDVNADAGTPNVIVGRNRAGTIVNIVSGALATAASGGIACSNTGGTTGLNGATTCSSTLQNTGLNAGDYLELVSGTPGGTAKFFVVHITYTVN